MPVLVVSIETACLHFRYKLVVHYQTKIFQRQLLLNGSLDRFYSQNMCAFSRPSPAVLSSPSLVLKVSEILRRRACMIPQERLLHGPGRAASSINAHGHLGSISPPAVKPLQPSRYLACGWALAFAEACKIMVPVTPDGCRSLLHSLKVP